MANKPFKKLRFSLTGDTYSPVDEQARRDIGDLSQLDTQHKDNLVEAINEAAEIGGSGGTGVPSGGSKGQVLTKLSSVEGDADWEYPPVMTARGNDPSNLTVTWNENYAAFDFYSRQELVQAEYVGSMVHLKLVKAYITVTLPDYATLYHFEFGGITEITNGTATIATLEVICDSPSAHSGVGVYTEAEIGVTDEAIQDAVDTYLDEHPTISGTFTNGGKNALLSLLEKVAYIDDNGQNYLNILRNELFNVAITSISAVYTQGTTLIYETDSLDALMPNLVVTAHYADESSEVVSGYSLSGTLSAGTSTITVTYEGQTDTFDVTVTAWDINWVYTDGLPNASGNPFTKTYTDGTATLTANGLECSGTNLGYTPKNEQTCSTLVFECVFIPEILSSQGSANGNGVKFAVFTGTRATTVSVNSKGICVYRASSSGYVVAYSAISTNTEYIIRIITDSSEGKIYLNGVLVYTVALASTSTTNSRVFAAASAGSGKTLFKRWSYKYLQ